MCDLPLVWAQGFGGYSVVQVALLVVVLAAVCALVHIALVKFGVAIPDFVVQAFWILIVAVVIIAAILFLARFAGFS